MVVQKEKQIRQRHADLWLVRTAIVDRYGDGLIDPATTQCCYGDERIDPPIPRRY